MAAITIDSKRLWNSLMDLAKIGATAKGGVCRLALTDLDRQARDLFTSWCTAAGCTVAVDGIGNIFARRPGRNDQLPPIIAGSHIDTQPSGGKFDGNFGVLAGLEVVRSLNDHGIQTEAPIEVVVWTNEEGSRFTPVMMGSGVFVDAFTLESTLQRTDLDGVTVGEALTKIGYSGSAPPGNRPVGAYFEAHIEQGPILEDSLKVICVVGGSLGYQKFWNQARTQAVLELGGRKATEPEVDNAAAIGARFQQAIGSRLVFRLDGFARWQESLDEGFGARTELLVRF